MPDTGAPWNIPYVAGTDLVSDWPADSLALANAIDAGLDAAGPAGIGSNVVQATKLDSFTTTSTSYTDITGLSVTITPSTATSKVLLICNVFLSQDESTGTAGAAYVALSGGNAGTFIGNADGSRVRTTSAYWYSDGTIDNLKYAGQAATIVYLDSPATTSATTYTAQARRARGGNVYINRVGTDASLDLRPAAASSLVAIEVAA